MELIDPMAWEAIETAELAELGSWPNGTAWLHETASCLSAVRIVRAEEAFWKAKMKIE